MTVSVLKRKVQHLRLPQQPPPQQPLPQQPLPQQQQPLPQQQPQQPLPQQQPQQPLPPRWLYQNVQVVSLVGVNGHHGVRALIAVETARNRD